MLIYVSSRIHVRHPELSADDVVAAFRSVMVDAERARNTYIAVGLDSKARSVEMIYKVNQNGDVLIYHALTPPTKKFMKEMKQLRSK